MGLDYDIVYKKGRENTATDAISRVPRAQIMELILSSIDTKLLSKIKRSWEQDQGIGKLIVKFSQSPHSHHKYT